MADTLYDVYDAEIENRRHLHDRETLDKLADIYEGKLPEEYARYFPKNTPTQKVNLVRLAWDDLATTIGRIPDLRGLVTNNSNAELQRVGKLEKIGHSYLHSAQPSAKMFMWEYAWWLLAGRACAIVVPDIENKRPSIELRDPRTCYPGAAKTAGNRIVELKDLLFKYEIDLDEARSRGLKGKTTQATQWGESREARKVKVIEYVDDTYWVIASDGGSVQRAEHGLGMVPGVFSSAFSPNQLGLSQFEDQISFMVGISLMLSMKMAYLERVVYPITWVRGHQGNLKLGPHVLQKLGPQGEMGQIAPSATIQVDRDIATLERYSRLLNKNPEVRSGEVQQKGTYIGAKTLEQLNEAIDTVIGRNWDIIGVDLQKLLHVCFEMDKRYWGNVEKSISGVKRGSGFYDKYVPNKDIGDYSLLRVDYGFGTGGYQGFLQNLQAKDAGVQSTRRAIEEMPGVSDVDQVLREIELERVDAVGHALFMSLAEQGQIDPVLWSDIRKDMAKKGWSLNEAIDKYRDRLIKRQEVANEAGIGNALEAGAEPPVEEAEAPPPLPGLPPVGAI